MHDEYTTFILRESFYRAYVCTLHANVVTMAVYIQSIIEQPCNRLVHSGNIGLHFTHSL